MMARRTIYGRLAATLKYEMMLKLGRWYIRIQYSLNPAIILSRIYVNDVPFQSDNAFAR